VYATTTQMISVPFHTWFFSFYSCAGEEVLEWEDRYKIAVGICKALVYLHDGSPRPVIHMNVKPSNFFLSHDFKPQVKNGTLDQLNLHQLCAIVRKNCSSSGVSRCWQWWMIFWVMAFNGLLTLVSDCYTVMIKGAVNFLAVDCSCQVFGLQNGLPKGQCTYTAMMWSAHLGNNSLAPIRNTGNLSNSPVSQSIKTYKLGFNEVM
jgi:hypothetical protein